MKAWPEALSPEKMQLPRAPAGSLVRFGLSADRSIALAAPRLFALALEFFHRPVDIVRVLVPLRLRTPFSAHLRSPKRVSERPSYGCPARMARRGPRTFAILNTSGGQCST